MQTEESIFMEKELRKRQSQLVEAGAGVILFAVWSMAKVNLFLGLSSISLDDVYDVASEVGINKTFFLAFIVFIFATILLTQLSIRLYIGLSATAEGKGKNKSWFYLVLTLLLLVTDIQWNWQAFGIDNFLAGEGLTASQITGICMEIASDYVLLELLISGIYVKRLKRQMKA